MPMPNVIHKAHLMIRMDARAFPPIVTSCDLYSSRMLSGMQGEVHAHVLEFEGASHQEACDRGREFMRLYRRDLWEVYRRFNPQTEEDWRRAFSENKVRWKWPTEARVQYNKMLKDEEDADAREDARRARMSPEEVAQTLAILDGISRHYDDK